MSNNTIIKVEGLSKHYLLNKNATQKSDTLYGNFINGIKSIKNITKKNETEDFWALKDVSFEIEKGDRVGIIGRNGAGKSTLLKILSRITPPTRGRIEYSGRMASLLEVGTGFHGDLSGRENIYLNGSILGMSKHEIDRKFDEIVAFAEIEKFLDTPVKRYSSGMYVRLAFAVAAHLEPEILIVDEVLAVGDSAFQKKCLGKMKDVSNSGRTILFVSHQLASVQSLCNKAIVLKKGMVDFPLSETNLSLKHYLKEVASLSKIIIADRTDREGQGNFRFKNVILKDNENQITNSGQTGKDLIFEIEYDINSSSLNNVSVAITIYNDEGRDMVTLANHIVDQPFETLKKENTIQCRVNKFPLTKGSYICNMIAYKDDVIQDYIQEAFNLEIEEGDFFGTGRIAPTAHHSFLIDNKWSIR
ncbi:MAG: ABC transporter ATP-binding protein [Burkholderiales bacterium]|nr:ABC transporter ATP-binding protein [Bacteroidia bacterium]